MLGVDSMDSMSHAWAQCLLQVLWLVSARAMSSKGPSKCGLSLLPVVMHMHCQKCLPGDLHSLLRIVIKFGAATGRYWPEALSRTSRPCLALLLSRAIMHVT